MEIDYAQLFKIYGNAPAEQSEVRYSLPFAWVLDRLHSGTAQSRSHFNKLRRTAEPHNANGARFTRLMNAFSKKVENHEAAIALHYMYYNFARIHQTLRVTPAMEAIIADHVWSLEEIVRLLD
jgi:hypothetical protein